MSPKTEPEYGPKSEELDAGDLKAMASKLHELATLIENESKKLAKVDGTITVVAGNYHRAVSKLQFWATRHVAGAVSSAVLMAKHR